MFKRENLKKTDSGWGIARKIKRPYMSKRKRLKNPILGEGFLILKFSRGRISKNPILGGELPEKIKRP